MSDGVSSSARSPTDLITPRAAALAKQLELFARTRVEGFLKSTNPSRLKGHSTDFRQHRPYVHGDDLRNLDWRVFARSDRLVTREYEEHTNLDVVLTIDTSGSMGYGSRDLTKFAFARHCVAMLAYLLTLQRDSFGLAAFGDRLGTLIPPATSRKHLARVLRDLCALEPQGETDFPACVGNLARRTRRRSLFIVLSDCYQDPASMTRALGTLRIGGHDVILYQVVDTHELDLPFPGITLFRDLETGQLDAADPAEIRRAYRDVAETHTRRLRERARHYGLDFSRVPTDDEWDTVLARLLRKRAARA